MGLLAKLFTSHKNNDDPYHLKEGMPNYKSVPRLRNIKISSEDMKKAKVLITDLKKHGYYLAGGYRFDLVYGRVRLVLPDNYAGYKLRTEFDLVTGSEIYDIDSPYFPSKTVCKYDYCKLKHA